MCTFFNNSVSGIFSPILKIEYLYLDKNEIGPQSSFYTECRPVSFLIQIKLFDF